MRRRIWISIGMLATLGALALPAGSMASHGADDPAGDDRSGGGGGGGNDVRSQGECTAASTSKIKAKADDGGVIEVEFEVDTNRNGVKWVVKLKDNGDRVARDTKRTKAPSGSFTYRKRIPNLAGTDRIVGLARNTQTGERCAAKVSL
jgi:hypothetical protein